MTPSAVSTILQPAGHHIEDAEVGDDPVDHRLAGQGQGAFLQHLGLAVLVGVVHDDHHAADAGDQIHRAAHALDQLAGDHPVRQIAGFRDLHRAEDRHRDLAAADHPEALAQSK